KERMNKYLDLSKGELEHLDNMIERVLQLDADENKGIHLLRESFDLVLLVRNCIDTAKVSTKKLVEVHFEHEVNTMLMFADKGHMKNVVSNLLDNALKYSADPVKIIVTLMDRGESIEIKIQDYGKGIAK